MTEPDQATRRIRPCGPADGIAMLRIISAAAEAYRGVIPPDRLHDPYMPAEELAAEMAEGVAFSGAEVGGRLVGVMGVQHRRNVDLIRHAYVLPEWQSGGIGADLLRHLCHAAERPILVGTWAAAEWAIRFYERHGFARVSDRMIAPLLRTYWTVPDRQIATSVVLANPPLGDDAARELIGAARSIAQQG